MCSASVLFSNCCITSMYISLNHMHRQSRTVECQIQAADKKGQVNVDCCTSPIHRWPYSQSTACHDLSVYNNRQHNQPECIEVDAMRLQWHKNLDAQMVFQYRVQQKKLDMLLKAKSILSMPSLCINNRLATLRHAVRQLQHEPFVHFVPFCCDYILQFLHCFTLMRLNSSCHGAPEVFGGIEVGRRRREDHGCHAFSVH